MMSNIIINLIISLVLYQTILLFIIYNLFIITFLFIFFKNIYEKMTVIKLNQFGFLLKNLSTYFIIQLAKIFYIHSIII